MTDTAGQPFEITLSGGGAAKASRGEGMVGTWKEEGKTAVITWNTGWTTEITLSCAVRRLQAEGISSSLEPVQELVE